MLRRPDFGLLLDRAQSAVAVAIGLCLIVAALIYLVPRQAKIASAVAEARRVAALDDTNDLRPTDMTLPAAAASPGPEADENAAPAPMPKLVSLQLTARNSAEASFSTLLARPVALDTATIQISRGKVKLAGIEAVPLSRRCGEGTGWLCGVEARTRFRAWLRARSISCDVPPSFGRDTQDVETACSLAGEDIGGWLVRNGWATAEPQGPYVADEARAKSAGLGVWAASRTAG